MATFSPARTSSVVLKNFLLLSLVLTIKMHTSQWKNHCACSKHARKKLSIGVDLKYSREFSNRNLFEKTYEHQKESSLSWTCLHYWHSTDQPSSFNPLMLKICGDVELNPGPIHYPCKDCGKSVRNNQNAILCSECNNYYWFHIKCLKMSSAIIKFYLKHPSFDRTYSSCELPNFSDLFFADEEDLVD